MPTPLRSTRSSASALRVNDNKLLQALQQKRAAKLEACRAESPASAVAQFGSGFCAGADVRELRSLLRSDATSAAAEQSRVQQLFKDQFTDKAQDPAEFHRFMRQVFGNDYDRQKAEQYRQRALKGDFGWLPKVEWVDAATLGGANGAYDAAAGVVYLNAELRGNPALAASTYVEEAGHHLDAQLNRTDAAGDEGELFRRLLSGEKLSRAQIRDIRAENDNGTIVVDGKEVEVEFWNPFKAIGDAITSVGKAIGGAVESVGKAIGSVVKGVVDTVGSAFKYVGQGIGGFFSNAFHGDFGAAFDSLLTGFDKGILQSPARLSAYLFDAADHLVDGFTGLLGPLGKPLSQVLKRGLDIGRTASDTVFGIARDLFRTPLEVVGGFASDTFGALKKLFAGDFGGAAEQFGMAFVNAGGRALGGVVDVLARALAGTASVIGTAIGVESPARGLTDAEKQMLREVYGDSVDLDLVRVKRGGIVSIGAARTVGNTIYLPDDYFDSQGNLTTGGLRTLSHEMGHVWQNQNGGGDYIHEALAAQAWAAITSGDRGGAYDWRAGMQEGKSFAELNPEQQASVIEEITWAIRNGTFDNYSYANAEFDYLSAALAEVRNGRGAP